VGRHKIVLAIVEQMYVSWRKHT